MSRPPWRQPVRAADALSAAFQRLGLMDRLRQHELWRVWPGVVGPHIARHAQPKEIRHGRLVVHVTDPVWLHQLSMMRHRLVDALNERLGRHVVREMALRIGEVPEMPSVSGPAPSGPGGDVHPDPERLASIEALLAPLGDAPFREELFRLLVRAAVAIREEKPR
jgi:predicted nucleic acid-binding Zn ribbon protein